MSLEKTRADSLRRYLTGATVDGGVQTDPDAAFGDFRSSTQITEMANAVTSPISDITVAFVSANNGVGAGTLTASGSDELKWTPPGGTQGPEVTILNGETRMVEGGAGAVEKFLIVSRTTATALTGAATVTITQGFNQQYDDVSSTEQTAGDTEYRAEIMKNESATQLTNLKIFIGTLGTDAVSDSAQLGASGLGTIVTTGTFSDWPDSGFVAIYNGAALREIAYYTDRTDTILTIPAAGRGLLGTSAGAGAGTDAVKAVPGIRIAKEDLSGQPTGFIQTIADESTSPAGRTWSTPHAVADGINIGTLAATNAVGLWIERTVMAGATSEAEVVNRIKTSYDAA